MQFLTTLQQTVSLHFLVWFAVTVAPDPILPARQLALIGSNFSVSLNYSVRPNPFPSSSDIVWRRGELILGNSGRYTIDEDGGRLTIHSVSLFDEAMYSATVTVIGSGMGMATMELITYGKSKDFEFLKKQEGEGPSCSISHKISKSDSSGGEPVICEYISTTANDQKPHVHSLISGAISALPDNQSPSNRWHFTWGTTLLHSCSAVKNLYI